MDVSDPQIHDLIQRSQAFCAIVGDRVVKPRTAAEYKKTFVRRWKTGQLDPLEHSLSRDTYGKRKAALYFTLSLWLGRLARGLLSASDREDVGSVRRWRYILEKVLERAEGVMMIDPPAPRGMSVLGMPRSRWHAEGNKSQRGWTSKKFLLPKLPRDWQSRVWEQAVLERFEYRVQLAILISIPCRSKELLQGIAIEVSLRGNLTIQWEPVKTRGWSVGRPWVRVIFDPSEANEPVRFLEAFCLASGGSCTVHVYDESDFRRQIIELGGRAVPKIKGAISPITYRQQGLADFKKTFGAGEKVAAVAGHSTDRPQARYGNWAHGTVRNGVVDIIVPKLPKLGNVAHGYEVGARPQQKEARKD